MKREIDFHIPDCEEFRKGYEIYNVRERRGFVYFEALELVQRNWGNPIHMAGGVQRLISSWNRFFANFNFDELSLCMERNIDILNSLRNRDISTLLEDDAEQIRYLFNELLDALKRTIDNRKSPVSVAKAFGLLAPHFLPIWDSNIAWRYGYLYFEDSADTPYINFCHKMKLMAERVSHCVPNPDDRSLLKRIDEYNYSKYTMNWI